MRKGPFIAHILNNVYLKDCFIVPLKVITECEINKSGLYL